MMNRYNIAGLTVDMDVSGRTLQQAQAYQCPADGQADIRLVCDLPRIMEFNPEITDEDVALYLATGAIFAKELLRFDGSFLHSSAVVVGGKAYLFSAPSGTGKSTHTEKWCRLFGASYLNDDKPVFRLMEDTWVAYGTPWSGKHDLSVNTGVPIGGIAILRRGQENKISPMEPARALPQILAQSSYRLNRQQMEKQLSLLDRLLREVPIWDLRCRNDDEAAYVAYQAMTAPERK